MAFTVGILVVAAIFIISITGYRNFKRTDDQRTVFL